MFLAKNDVVLDPDDDAAYDLVVAVAAGETDDVAEIAPVLKSLVQGIDAAGNRSAPATVRFEVTR